MTNDRIYNPERLSRYPHMFPLDIAIWERFIDRHGTDFSGFSYDVKVGSGSQPIEGLGSVYERMQAILSKYRIDCVGYKPGAVYIIEVKPEAGTIAAGEIELYTSLYARDFSPAERIVGCIVTDRLLPDMDWYCQQKGIELFIV